MATRTWTRGVAGVRCTTGGCVFSGVLFVAGEGRVFLFDRDIPTDDASRHGESGRAFAENESAYVRKAHRRVYPGTWEMENSLTGRIAASRFVG